METKIIKTEVKMSFWIWSARKILRQLKRKHIKYIESIETQWSIWSPLKIKATVMMQTRQEGK